MGFRSLLSIVVALVHLYLWWRTVHDTRLARVPRYLATLALFLLWLSLPLTMFYAERDGGLGTNATMFAFVWLGMMFYAFVLLLAWDALRLLRWLGARLRPRRAELPPAPETAQTRRVFVARAAAGSALIATAGIGAFGVRSALWDITRPELSVALARFPRALDGYTIALISDVHIGPTLDGRFLRDVVDQTNRMRPDLIAITGDLVDGTVGEIGGEIAQLARLRARDGVYFVTGNHEYYWGAGQWIAFLRRHGLRVLLNERVTIGDAAQAGAHFDLAGVPDHRAGAYADHAPDARRATAGRDRERELIMLAHQPVQVAASAAVGAGLQLSGHTHGGQLYPFGALTLLSQPYLSGLHRHEATGTQVYVSRGTGFWGPPMRVLAPAEIARIRLIRA